MFNMMNDASETIFNYHLKLVDSEDLKGMSVSDIKCYKYARLASCDVERTFSQNKPLP
jgi:hypothetical protein